MDTNILVEFATFYFTRSMINIYLLVLWTLKTRSFVGVKCTMENKKLSTSIQTPFFLREHFLAKDFAFHFVSLHFLFITERFCLEDLVWTSCSNRNKKSNVGRLHCSRHRGKSTKNWVLNISDTSFTCLKCLRCYINSKQLAGWDLLVL